MATLSQHDLTGVVGQKLAIDIEVVARFTVVQHLCDCRSTEPSHIVGADCPPHPQSESFGFGPVGSTAQDRETAE